MPKLPSKVRGKYQVCVKGKRQGFGVVGGVRKPDGIIVHADGRCVFSEYAGGFDGFWSTDAGDGHEDGLARAAKRVRTPPFSADVVAVTRFHSDKGCMCTAAALALYQTVHLVTPLHTCRCWATRGRSSASMPAATTPATAL